MKILIADDHVVVRRGLRQVLSEQEGLDVVGEAWDAPSTLELVHELDWDLLVLDVSMPGRSGIEVLKLVKQEYPGRPVLILSMHPEEQFAVRAFKAGASGYLTKESASEELVAAVKRVSHGEKYVSSTLANCLINALNLPGEPIRHQLLSDREYEVMRLLAVGKTVSEIADQLYLSVKTISTHRTHILEKLHLKNNAELMRYAMMHKLVE